MATQAPPIADADAGRPAGAVLVGSAASLLFFVPGEPEPAHRPRSRVVTPRGGGKPFVQVYQDSRVTEYEERVATWVRRQIATMPVELPMGGQDDLLLPFEEHAVYLRLVLYLRRPSTYPKRVVQHTRKPDLDNLMKTVIDGLVKAKVIKDDGMIVELSAAKRYASHDHPLGVEIDLTAVRTPVP